MNKQNKYSTNSVRFRRWSRAGYAVFISLTCVVSIGTLSVSVCDKSNLKSDANATISKTLLLNDESDDDNEEILADVQLISALVVSEKSTDIAAAAHSLKNYIQSKNG